MENSYGIGIANRFELFYEQEDVTEFETVVKKKKEKKEKKEPATQTNSTPATTQLKSSSTVGKENKQTKKVLENGTGAGSALNNDQSQRRGIKEQNNKDNLSTIQRKDTDKGNKDTKNREERNNRRNREMNGTTEFDKPRGGATGNGTGTGQRNNNQRSTRGGPFADGRKRERDRQSGSDKTGVKSVDKRDGNGAHNWGSHKQDIDDLNKPPTDDEQKESADDTAEESTTVVNAEEEPKEMTLDEWKAQRQATLLQPQYNIRKAGEGEDKSQWENMKRLDTKKGDNDSARKDDAANLKKDEAKKKQLLDIEFHFSDNRRGGLGRRSGGDRGGEGRGDRGDRGNRGGNRDRGDRGEGGNREDRGPREDREDRPPRTAGGERGGDRPRRPRPNRENGEAAAAPAANQGGDSGDQNRRRRRFDNPRRAGGVDKNVPNAPKVDDERDFPSLG